MSRSDIATSVMTCFLSLFDTFQLKRYLNSLELSVTDFLVWIRKAAVPTAEDFMSKIDDKVSRRKLELEAF